MNKLHHMIMASKVHLALTRAKVPKFQGLESRKQFIVEELKKKKDKIVYS